MWSWERGTANGSRGGGRAANAKCWLVRVRVTASRLGIWLTAHRLKPHASPHHRTLDRLVPCARRLPDIELPFIGLSLAIHSDSADSARGTLLPSRCGAVQPTWLPTCDVRERRKLGPRRSSGECLHTGGRRSTGRRRPSYNLAERCELWLVLCPFPCPIHRHPPRFEPVLRSVWSFANHEQPSARDG